MQERKMRKEYQFMSIVLVVIFIFSLNLRSIQKTRAPNFKQADDNLTNAIKHIQGASVDIQQMGAIYQAMYSLLKQAHDKKKDKIQEAIVAGGEKIQKAKDSIKDKEEEIRKRREAAKDQFITSCVLSIAKCYASIVGAAGAAQHSMAEVYFYSPAIVLRYKSKVRIALNKFKDLKVKIQNVVKDYNKHPYKRKQKHRISQILRRLDRLKPHLEKTKEENDNYLNKLKAKKRKRKKK